MGDHMKMNFDYFQVQKMNVTNRTEKGDEKYGDIFLVSMFPS